MRLSHHGIFHEWARGAAALLLVLQATAGGMVALAHATDSTGGPPALESRHSTQCVVLHDSARCAQCQYASARTLPGDSGPVPPLDFTSRVTAALGNSWTPQAHALYASSPPRAPPVSLV